MNIPSSDKFVRTYFLDMPLDTVFALSQNKLAYTISMTSCVGRALKVNVEYVAIVHSLMVMKCLSMSRTC